MNKPLSPPKNGKSPRAAAPPLPEIGSDLEGIPYLGVTRRAALALAGLRTRNDLRRATAEEIGGVKGVGMGNAARVKDWLQSQEKAPTPLAGSLDLTQAESNQQVQEIFEKLEAATSRLKENLPTKSLDKSLERQLSKLDTVASELAEGPDTLTAKQVEKAVRTLDKIAELLGTAADAEKLSPKKRSALIDALRERRKRLQKNLGD